MADGIKLFAGRGELIGSLLCGSLIDGDGNLVRCAGSDRGDHRDGRTKNKTTGTDEPKAERMKDCFRALEIGIDLKRS